MRSRIPLIVAVVGALLIGGATTGGTNASWVSQKPLAAHGVTAGSMSSGGTASPSALTVNRAASGTVEVLVSDSSAGKNMRQRVTPSVTATVGAATLVTKTGGACTTTAQPAVDLAPAASFTTCVRYTAPDSAATSATITVTLAGRQVRAGNLTGWSAAPTLTIPVTIRQPATPPSAPVLACAPARDGNNWNVTWSVDAALDYTVHLSTQPTTAFTVVPQTSPGVYSVVMGTNNTVKYVKITASNGGLTSGFSNTLKVSQGNGASSLSCGAP